jgi:hypothetical protein
MKKPYKKPEIKSSKIKTISLYSRRAMGSAADAEYLLAWTPV